MKFQLLPLGARFEFEGKAYVKSGPLTAVAEDGAPRMIPRYAALRPVAGEAPPPPSRPARQLDEARVLAAFEDFHAACQGLLGASGATGEQTEALGAGLSAARDRFLAALG